MSWSGALALFNPRFPRFSSVESPPESRSFLSSNFTSAPLSCCWLARSLLFSVLGAFRLEKRRLRSPDDRNSGVVEFDARKLDFVTGAARFFVSRRENAPPSELQVGQPGVQCHFVLSSVVPREIDGNELNIFTLTRCSRTWPRFVRNKMEDNGFEITSYRHCFYFPNKQQARFV